MLEFVLVGVEMITRFFMNRGIQISFEGNGPEEWRESWVAGISATEQELGVALPVSANFWITGGNLTATMLNYQSGSKHTIITIERHDDGRFAGEIVANGRIYAPDGSHEEELAAARQNRFFNVYRARISRDNPCRCEMCNERRGFRAAQEW